MTEATRRPTLSLGWPALVLTVMALRFYPFAFGAIVLAILGLVRSTGRPNRLAAALALALSLVLLAVVFLGRVTTHGDVNIRQIPLPAQSLADAP